MDIRSMLNTTGTHLIDDKINQNIATMFANCEKDFEYN